MCAGDVGCPFSFYLQSMDCLLASHGTALAISFFLELATHLRSAQWRESSWGTSLPSMPASRQPLVSAMPMHASYSIGHHREIRNSYACRGASALEMRESAFLGLAREASPHPTRSQPQQKDRL